MRTLKFIVLGILLLHSLSIIFYIIPQQRKLNREMESLGMEGSSGGAGLPAIPIDHSWLAPTCTYEPKTRKLISCVCLDNRIESGCYVLDGKAK